MRFIWSINIEPATTRRRGIDTQLRIVVLLSQPCVMIATIIVVTIHKVISKLVLIEIVIAIF